MHDDGRQKEPGPDGDATSAELGAPTSWSTRALPEEGPSADSPSAEEDPLPGQVIGGVRVSRLIARGGQARVYEASDAKGMPCALKVFRSGRGRSAQMRELRAIRELKHAAIVSPLAWSEADEPGPTWIRMPLAPWGDALKASGRLSPEAAVRVTLRLLGALAAAHGRLLVHGDVKAENILFFSDPAGADPDVRLTDFGVHLSMHELETRELHGIWGTPGLSAPEQQSPALRDAGPWTDLYGLGTCLAQLKASPGSEAERATDAVFSSWLDSLQHADPTMRFRSAGSAADALLEALDRPDLFRHAAMLGAGQAVLRRQRMALVTSASGSDEEAILPFRQGARGLLLQRLLDAVIRCRRDGAVRWLHVLGEEGSGKTTLAEVLSHLLLQAGTPRVLTAVPAPYAAGSVLMDALHTGFRVDGLLDFEILRRLKRWATAFGIHDPSLLRMLAAALAATNEGLSDQRAGSGNASDVATGVLAHMASADPLVLIVDDFRSPSRALDELRQLRTAAAQMNATLLILSIGEDALPDADEVHELPLLTPEASEALAGEALGELDASDVRRTIAAWAGGAPGMILSAAGLWQAKRRLELHPASDVAQRVAQALADLCAEGQAAWLGTALAREIPAERAPRHAATFSAKSWLVPAGNRLRWRRDSERQAVLDWGRRQLSVPSSPLREHLRADGELDLQGRFERCVLLSEIEHLPAAAIARAREAFDQGDRWAAIGVLEQTRALISGGVQAPALPHHELLLLLANLYRLAGRIQEAGGLLGSLTAPEGPPRLRGLHQLAVAQVDARAGRMEEAELRADEALRLFRECGDARMEGQASWLTGSLCRRLGRAEEARRHLTWAISRLEQGGDQHALAVSWIGLGHLYFRAGEPDQALDAWSRGAELCERGGYPVELAHIRLAVGDMHRADGDIAAASSLYSAAELLFASTGSASVCLARLNMALVALDLGDWSAATEVLARVRRTAALDAHLTWASWLQVLEARLEAEQGSKGPATEALRVALESDTLVADRDDPDLARCIRVVFPGWDALHGGESS